MKQNPIAKIGIKANALILVALFITGAVLRLCGVLSVSWWLITLPLWGGVLVCLLALGFFTLCVLIVAASAGSRAKRRAAAFFKNDTTKHLIKKQ